MPTRAADVAVGSDVRCWEPLHRALGTGPVSMVLRTAIVEDLATLEQIQPALESGAKPYFNFSRTMKLRSVIITRWSTISFGRGLLDCNRRSLLWMSHVPLLERTKQI
jgi:hypothetical protein